MPRPKVLPEDRALAKGARAELAVTEKMHCLQCMRKTQFERLPITRVARRVEETALGQIGTYETTVDPHPFYVICTRCRRFVVEQFSLEEQLALVREAILAARRPKIVVPQDPAARPRSESERPSGLIIPNFS